MHVFTLATVSPLLNNELVIFSRRLSNSSVYLKNSATHFCFVFFVPINNKSIYRWLFSERCVNEKKKTKSETTHLLLFNDNIIIWQHYVCVYKNNTQYYCNNNLLCKLCVTLGDFACWTTTLPIDDDRGQEVQKTIVYRIEKLAHSLSLGTSR